MVQIWAFIFYLFLTAVALVPCLVCILWNQFDKCLLNYLVITLIWWLTAFNFKMPFKKDLYWTCFGLDQISQILYMFIVYFLLQLILSIRFNKVKCSYYKLQLVEIVYCILLTFVCLGIENLKILCIPK